MLEKKLTKLTILNKKFKADVKGYDALEVDQFLDLICQDYDRIEAFLTNDLPKLNLVEQQVKDLKGRLRQLELDNAELKEKTSVLDKNTTSEINHENYKLYRRIGILEKELYKLGIDPNKLK
jgi:DivIVA domain-containing protein